MSLARPVITTLVDRIRADLDARLKGADSRLSRSLLDVLARVEAGAVDGLYAYLGSIADDVMPDRADTAHLDRWASIWGVARSAAAAAAGSVTVSGADGAFVPAGSVLLRRDGARFVAPVATPLVAGAATVAVTADAAGAAGDTAAGVSLAFASPANGVGALAVVAAAGITGGIDEESDDTLRARLLARIQSPPAGGAAADYLAWALAQPEVTRAWVFPNWLGAGSVGVGVVMDRRPVIYPTPDDVASVQAALDALRPVTAALTVFAPVPMPTPYVVRLSPSTLATRAVVMAQLADLYAREAAPGGTLLISHIREAIATAGVNDYELLVPAGNIVAPKGQIPAIGAVTWL